MHTQLVFKYYLMNLALMLASLIILETQQWIRRLRIDHMTAL